MSYVDELSLKLTAKDEMSSRLKGLRKELGDVEKAMSKARSELENTGSPEAAAELKRLEQQWVELTQAQAKNRKEQAANEAAMKKLRAQAELSQTTAAKLGRAWTKTANVFSNDLVAGMSAAALFMGGRKFLNAFAEAEAMQAQLELSYRKFPESANLSIDALRDYNDELMRSTGADDDALAAAEGMLMRFGLTASQIRTLIPLVNDLSIAKGVSLTDGATAVGKAIQGQTRALKDVGIVYKATGDASTDLANIQALLTEKVGGMGEAFGMTAAGRMQAASKEFENLQENIGQQLVPAMELFTGVGKTAMDLFDDLPDGAKATAVAVGFLGSAALIATPRIIAMKAAMVTAGMTGATLKSNLRSTASFLVGPWGIALAGATVGLGLFIEDQQRARDAARGFSDALDAQTGAVVDSTYAHIADRLSALITTGTEWDRITKATGKSQQDFIAIIAAGGKPLDDLRGQLKGLGSDGNALEWALSSDARMFNAASQAVNQVHEELRDGKEAWKATTELSTAAGGSVEEFGDSAEETAAKINPLTRAMNRFSHALDVHDALVAWKKAQEDFIKKPSKDTAEAAARAYASVVGTYKEGGKAQANFVASNFDEMTAIINKSGMSDALKAQLIDQLADGNDEALALIANLDRIAKMRMISSGAIQNDPRLLRAQGGPVFGPGTATSDSIPARLSNGEWVIRANSVTALQRTYGRGVMSALNNADRTRPPLIRTEAPRPVAPRVLVNAGARIGQMTTQVNASGQIDYELAQRRTARKMLRESRARTAGSRS